MTMMTAAMMKKLGLFMLCLSALVVCSLVMIPARADAAAVSQVAVRFPDEHQTSCVLVRNRRVFRGYRGQGVLYINNHGLHNADVYVNGHRVDIRPALAAAEGLATVDISSYTVDGDNVLKAERLTPDEAYMDIAVPYPVLRRGTAEQAGFSAARLNKLDDLINADVAKGFPGAVLLVVKNGLIIKDTAYGWAKKYQGNMLLPQANRQQMTTATLFDLASNTKMYAATLAMMKLTDEGLVSPEDLLVKYLPGCTGDGREKLRIRDIMTHSAGFAPFIKIYRSESGAFYTRDRDTALNLLAHAPIVYPPGTKTVYSDTDYILLCAVIEKITGERLDAYVEDNIYRPLGLNAIVFNPLEKGFLPSQIAATERNGNTRDGMVDFPGVRRYTIQGEVQDEQAYYSLGGVSGHAGLFASADDLAVLAQMMLNGGGYGSYRLCSADTELYFTKPTDRNPDFGLGWNKGGRIDRQWEFGPYASREAIGHTGWTGTFIGIDPHYDLAVIYLTNRVHTPNVVGKPNTFMADALPSSDYGNIMSLVYEAFLEHTP